MTDRPMKKLLLILVAWFAVGAIAITYQDVRDARFRRRHGLHPYWRTHHTSSTKGKTQP